jgi:hypothetical protein
MKMGLIVVAALAASMFASPVWAGTIAGSSSEAGVNGGSAGSSTVTVTANDKGSAEAGTVFGVGEATSTNTATGTDTTKGFAYANFEAGGNSFADEASHF